MSAVYVSNLVINTGEDFSQQFTLQDADDNGSLDLTDYTVASQIRKHAGSSTATDFTIDISSPKTLGRITVKLTNSQTNSLKPGRYLYDIVLTRFGIKTKVVEGMVLVRQGVTR